jgi:putative FmdB family regulatory protein
MPLYEYECYLCGHRFERILRVADASDVTCPKCDGKVRRLLSAPALQFKGSGWYVTDYGKGNGKRSTALAKTENGDAPASPPTKADSSKKETSSKKDD